jgi:hypothetical protein
VNEKLPVSGQKRQNAAYWFKNEIFSVLSKEPSKNKYTKVPGGKQPSAIGRQVPPGLRTG